MQDKIIGISNFTYEHYNLFFNIADNLVLNGYKVIFLFPNNTLKIILKNRKYSFIDSEKGFKNITNKLSKVLFWESSSKNSEYLINFSKRNNIETIFFENGYFPNTFQIDKEGQNKNSSIYKMKYKEILNFHREEYKNSYNIKIINFRLKFLEKIKLTLNLINTLNSIKNYINFKKLEKVRKQILKNEKNKGLKKGKYIFIPFQVHDDSQILLNSNIIKKMDDILNFFYNDIKTILPNHKIVVKEHPMDLGRIDYSNLREKFNDIIWFKGGDLEDIINKSDYIIVTNSSVGLQSLEKGKKILLLGDAFYQNNPFIEKIQSKKDFKIKINNLINKNLSKKEVNTYIDKFKNEIFFSGSYKNFNENHLNKILNYIIKKS